MPRFDITNALDGAPEFVAEAVERFAVSLGDTHPTVVAGRRAKAALDAIPDGAMLVTEESLAAAIHRAFPARRNTESGSVLTAAVILAALRTEP